MFGTREKIIETIYAALPYSNQIKNIDISNSSNDVSFDWRGTRYKVSENGSVIEVNRDLAIGSDICIVMRELFKREFMASLPPVKNS